MATWSFDCNTTPSLWQRSICPTSPCECNGSAWYNTGWMKVWKVEGQIGGNGHIEVWLRGASSIGGWTFVGAVDLGSTTHTEAFTFDVAGVTADVLLFSTGYCTKLVDGTLQCSGSNRLMYTQGVVTYGDTNPVPICGPICCEGDTQTIPCEGRFGGTYEQVCLCVGECNWWNAEGMNCPVCTEEAGDPSNYVYQTCWDGSQIITQYCDNGQYYPTTQECPPPPCIDGEQRQDCHCWDGYSCRTEQCFAGEWWEIQSCPPCCQEGEISGTECWDGSCVGNYCHNCSWLPCYQSACSTPPKGTIIAKEGSFCPDGSQLYLKWNGRAWVEVSCTSTRPTKPPKTKGLAPGEYAGGILNDNPALAIAAGVGMTFGTLWIANHFLRRKSW